MKKSTLIDKAATPDGGVIALYEHDGSYTIRINGHELMSTRRHDSEEALATRACQPFRQQKNVRVLIGGLGFGFTLRAALHLLGADAYVAVAEIVPAVVAWNRNPAYPFAGRELADPRVQICEQDVAEVIQADPAGFDVILLDVDNGPCGLSAASNQLLYDRSGLRRTKAALRPGGCLGIWSAGDDSGFGKRMRQAGFRVEAQHAQAHASSRATHVLFFGWLS